jgi:hypothetical protein
MGGEPQEGGQEGGLASALAAGEDDAPASVRKHRAVQGCVAVQDLLHQQRPNQLEREDLIWVVPPLRPYPDRGACDLNPPGAGPG